MRAAAVLARSLSCVAIVFAAASCSGSSSDGPNGPPALTNKIVFVSDRTGANQLHVMSGNGDVIQLLATTPGPKTDPVISPDGKRIVFTVGTLAEGTASPLWIVNSDGTGLKQLTSDGALDVRPTWSPDGSRIAFTSDRDGNAEIYVMKADGTGQTNITNNAADDDTPAWSPDGNTILFSSDRDTPGAEGKVYSMTTSGGSVTPLVNGSDPEWSPSGSRFLFKRAAQIWISESATGSTVRQVTFDDHFHFTPGWSPDESKIVFASDSSGNEEIWSVNSADGGSATQLTSDSDGESWTPNWSRH
jgi:Tol biopolymer transport system component